MSRRTGSTPQIAEMREAACYAVEGRSVLLSSHQLAEVEQTCSHVVVMDRGSVIASGTVAEVSAIVPASSRHRLEDAFLAMIGTGAGCGHDREDRPVLAAEGAALGFDPGARCASG